LFNLGGDMPKKKGTKGGKTLLPIKFQICYPDYKNRQKGISIRKIRQIATTPKPKRDPRYIVPKVIKKKNT